MTHLKAVLHIDAKGLDCPMPLLKLKQALNRLDSGEIVSLVATDAGSMRDFKVFTEQSGHVLLKADEQQGVFEYFVQKKTVGY